MAGDQGRVDDSERITMTEDGGPQSSCPFCRTKGGKQGHFLVRVGQPQPPTAVARMGRFLYWELDPGSSISCPASGRGPGVEHLSLPELGILTPAPQLSADMGQTE